MRSTATSDTPAPIRQRARPIISAPAWSACLAISLAWAAAAWWLAHIGRRALPPLPFGGALLGASIASCPLVAHLTARLPHGIERIALWFALCIGLGLAYRLVIHTCGSPAQLVGDAPARWIAMDRLDALVAQDPRALLHREAYDTNSPLADLFFWGVRQAFGVEIALLPWQVYIHLLLAYCTLELGANAGLSPRASQIGFWAVLLCPGYIFLAMYMHRSNLITLALLLAAIGLQRALAVRPLAGMPLLGLGMLLILGLRLSWASLLTVWLLLAPWVAARPLRLSLGAAALALGIVAGCYALLPHFIGQAQWHA